MTARLRVADLGVSYPGERTPALSGVSLEIAVGERVAVIGESGSGKSTLARAVAGLLPPGCTVSGSIDWPELGRPARPGIDHGFVFQDAGASLDPLMRIGAQVAEVLRALRRLDRRAADAQALRLLEAVRLPHPAEAARAYPHQLSGGQKQRAAVAAAIAGRPGLLIADEPTSALDTVVQAALVSLLLRLCAERGMALLFVTHDIALASQVADRIAVLRGGRLVEQGATRDVVRAPRSAYTRSLLAAHLGLEGVPAPR